eukprot:2441176-Rhodomonas_salina.1
MGSSTREEIPKQWSISYGTNYNEGPVVSRRRSSLVATMTTPTKMPSDGTISESSASPALSEHTPATVRKRRACTVAAEERAKA